MRLIWHIENKADNKHHYFASLSALFIEFKEIGVSRSKITKDSRNLETWEIDTGLYILRKDRLYSVSDF